jgi:Zn-finger nucleic acid-binding protein
MITSSCLQLRKLYKSGDRVMENEKDRFDEKTPFVERAKEDTYFAAKEHELIEGMKAEFQKVEAARREGQIVNCPKCPGRLEKYRFMGFVLDRCESCEGIWLNKGELKGILRKAARGPLGAFVERYFPNVETGTKRSGGWWPEVKTKISWR